MKLTFLGTGTSYGVPFVGCHCAICQSHDAHDKRLRSSILVEAEHNGEAFRILVDTTPDLRQQLLRSHTEILSAVVWTHDHNDHVIGLDDLRPICNVVGYIDGYARQDTMARLQKIFDYVWVQDRPYANFPRLTPHIIEPNQSFALGPFRVTPIDIRHGQREILAYRFECGNQALVYATDCSQIPDASWPHFANADVLVVGALRHKEHPTHFNIEQALEVVRRAQPERAFFTHIAHELGHQATNQTLPENVALAFDNQSVDLKEIAGGK